MTYAVRSQQGRVVRRFKTRREAENFVRGLARSPVKECAHIATPCTGGYECALCGKHLGWHPKRPKEIPGWEPPKVRKISASSPIKEIAVKVASLYGWGPKLAKTMREIRDGKLSYSSHEPLRVSRLDSPKGGFFILDGHHRAIEAALEDKNTVKASIDPIMPRIERTGGAHRDIVLAKVRVLDALHAFSPV